MKFLAIFLLVTLANAKPQYKYQIPNFESSGSTIGSTFSIPTGNGNGGGSQFATTGGGQLISTNQLQFSGGNGNGGLLLGNDGGSNYFGAGNNGLGASFFTTGNGGNSFSGGNGGNSFSGGNGASSFSGGNGGNSFSGGNGANSFSGGNGVNSFSGGNGVNSFSGGNGGGGGIFISSGPANNLGFANGNSGLLQGGSGINFNVGGGGLSTGSSAGGTFDTGFSGHSVKEINLQDSGAGNVEKHLYLHVAPPDNEEYKIVVKPPPQRTQHRIIFIKAPTQVIKPKIVQYEQQVQDKTLIYVLVKKPDVSTTAQIIKSPPPKPEVYFIKYKAPKEGGAENVISETINSVSTGESGLKPVVTINNQQGFISSAGSGINSLSSDIGSAGPNLISEGSGDNSFNSNIGSAGSSIISTSSGAHSLSSNIGSAGSGISSASSDNVSSAMKHTEYGVPQRK